VTRNLSLIRIGCVSRQAGVDVTVGGAPVCVRARARKSTVLWLILCVFGFWISSEGANADRPECAGAYGARPSSSVAGVGVANGRRLANGWAEDLPLTDAMFRGGGNGILENAGVALFVCGLSPYLLRGLAQQPDNYACLREPEEYQQAGEQRRFPLHLEFVGWLFLCGFVSWRGALWMSRR